MTSTPEPVAITLIEPSEGWISLNIREIWAYRELLFFLVWRDIKVRYKQTVLGASWAVIQPFMTMVVFSLFFGKLGKIPSDGVPYPIFSFAALVPWTFFATGLSQCSSSLVGNQRLLRKVYFPRLIIPIAAVASGFVDFLIAFGVLLVLMLFFSISITVKIFLVIPLVCLAFIAALAVGTWLSALNVQFRDVRYTLPFMVQLWLFATPIAYPSSLLPESWRAVYGLNPMAGVVEGFRWALLGTETTPGAMVAVSAAMSLALLIGGLYYFRRLERTFADVV